MAPGGTRRRRKGFETMLPLDAELIVIWHGCLSYIEILYVGESGFSALYDMCGPIAQLTLRFLVRIYHVTRKNIRVFKRKKKTKITCTLIYVLVFR
ncbi:hypothetical protein DAI22_10g098200 [Oryza sativa Japonica Group]|nr:hypothetical protein DAI22_10g098200 [Oryza sativa Japonica Group]